MQRSRSTLALALIGSLTFLFAAACGSSNSEAVEEPDCATPCGAGLVCVQGDICACAPGFAECDGDPANGCETIGTCQNPTCTSESDAIFCARNVASCGVVTAADNCDRSRSVDCGSCAKGKVCGAKRPNVCDSAECTGEADRVLCTANNRECGAADVTDRCGETRSIACGSCPAGEECNGQGRCKVSLLGERARCYDGGTFQGTCGAGLVCSGTPDLAVCMRHCRSDAHCSGGQTCALDYWADGSTDGVCGDLRKDGESCRWPEDGSNFCWDNAYPDDNPNLACVNGTCGYVCNIQGGEFNPCSRIGGDRDCGSWQYWEEVGRDVKVCNPVRVVGDHDRCAISGVVTRACEAGFECIFFGWDGLCMEPCTSDDGCADGRSCAVGIMPDGSGLCGDLRAPGEDCHPLNPGKSDWCWDAANPDLKPVCLVNKCEHICELDRGAGIETWPCPDGLTCGAASWNGEYGMTMAACVDNRVGEKRPCSSDAECLPGLACVDDGTTSVCQPVCGLDADCADGRICRAGILADGRSACIDPQAEGESCSASVQSGSKICIDDDPLTGTSLECAAGTCRHVCDWESDGLPAAACQTGFTCSATFGAIPGHADRGAICEPPCIPETDAQLCSRAGAQCGQVTTTDRCGTQRTATCSTCSSGSACNGNSCISWNIPVNGACLDRNRNFVGCATGLTCVTWGTGADEYGACKQACYSDFECPGTQSCATGLLVGGQGICGTPRQQGQSCSSIRTGSNFCWDIGSPSGALFDCLAGSCAYVCAVENVTGQYSCPWGQTCGAAYHTYPESPARLRVCE